MSKYQATSQPCPGCGSSDSLAIYNDGNGYCFSTCGYMSEAKLSGTHKPRTKKMSRWDITEVESFPVADL